jgi:hypothetical protein
VKTLSFREKSAKANSPRLLARRELQLERENGSRKVRKDRGTKAIETIAAIAGVVLSFRNKEKPTLAEVARIANGDDKKTVENTTEIQISRKYGLVS